VRELPAIAVGARTFTGLDAITAAAVELGG